MTRYCVDCIHYNAKGSVGGLCERPITSKVTGETFALGSNMNGSLYGCTASAQRQYDPYDVNCGPRAKYFKARNAPNGGTDDPGFFARCCLIIKEVFS